MADSVIKVIYFGVAGRAEAIRLLLTAAGKEFEDVKITGEQWKELKPTSPCGTLPILDIDGKQFGQSRAIASFLARELGLFGEKSLDGLKIDQIALVAEDFVMEFSHKFYFAPDAEKKAEGEKYLKEEAAPKYLGLFEKYLKEEGTGFIAGSKLSLGDVVVYDVCTGFLKHLVEDSVSKFPLVKALVDTVAKNERIAEYLSKKAHS